MYLSHNIVNLLVRVEIALAKVQVNFPPDKVDFESGVYTGSRQRGKVPLLKLQQDGAAQSLYYMATLLGQALTPKDARQVLQKTIPLLGDGKTKSVEALADASNSPIHMLSHNLLGALNICYGAAFNPGLRVDDHLLLELHKQLAPGFLGEGAIGYRETGQGISRVFEPLLEIVEEELRDLSARGPVQLLFDEFRQQTEQNYLYRVSLILYGLLTLHPLRGMNLVSILMLADTLHARHLGWLGSLLPSAEFWASKQDAIKAVFAIPEAPRREVSWHELWLQSLLERSEHLLADLSEDHLEVETSAKKTGNLNNQILDLNKRQLSILKYLQTIHTVKREDYVEMLDVSAMTAYRDLQQLIDNGLLKTIGRGRGTKYALTSK